MGSKLFLASAFFFAAVTVACRNENNTGVTLDSQPANTTTTENTVVAETTQAGESASTATVDIKDRLQTCVACHGENGVSVIPANPVLAGQEFYYLYVQLKDLPPQQNLWVIGGVGRFPSA